MEAQTTIRPRWTASRLFWVSLASIPISLVCAFISFRIWMGFAWDWDVTEPTLAQDIPCYIFGGAGIVCLVGGVISFFTMIISGVVALLKRRRYAA